MPDRLRRNQRLSWVASDSHVPAKAVHEELTEILDGLSSMPERAAVPPRAASALARRRRDRLPQGVGGAWVKLDSTSGPSAWGALRLM
jgi:hypothetical protein